MSDLYSTRKVAIFYLYSKLLNEDSKLEYFVEYSNNNNKSIDMEYLKKLISVYDPKKGKNILTKISEKENLTLLHIVILCFLKSENSIHAFTKDDIFDYLKISIKYTDKFLADFISFLAKTKSLKLI